MYTINQRVLYMGHHTWHICSVSAIVDEKTVVLTPTSGGCLQFDARIERCVPVPSAMNTIEDMIKYLSKAGNWK